MPTEGLAFPVFGGPVDGDWVEFQGARSMTFVPDRETSRAVLVFPADPDGPNNGYPQDVYTLLGFGEPYPHRWVWAATGIRFTTESLAALERCACAGV